MERDPSQRFLKRWNRWKINPILPEKSFPKYQNVSPFPIGQTHIQKLLPCYMFDQASPSYSQNFPPLESFDHPQTNTKHVWKIKNPVGTNLDGTKK